jgi:3-hydroxybutyryl-CoA dehydrogenase
MEIRKVGVAGCGQMGAGIAQVCARAGYPVTVSEVNSSLLDRGLDRVKSNLSTAVAGNRLPAAEMTATILRIHGTTDPADFTDCDIVIEAAVEDLEVKQALFRKLDTICRPDAVLSTNTSSLSVRNITSGVSHPERVLGTHFFNPVPAMKLVELVRTDNTGEQTKEAVAAFVRRLGKTPVLAGDTPGFIVNRLMTPQLLSAIRLVEDGVATQDDVDTAMTLGLNAPLGPLALADLIGLDTLLAMADSMHDGLGEEQYAAPAMLKEKVAAGELGRKSGRGFYHYTEGGARRGPDRTP